jgi:hypothetical protein
MLTRVTRTGATWSLLLALASVGLFYLADPQGRGDRSHRAASADHSSRGSLRKARFPCIEKLMRSSGVVRHARAGRAPQREATAASCEVQSGCFWS